MRVVGYARRSTKKQKYSLDVQRRAIENYCRENEHSLIEIIEETATGKNLNREGVIKAIDMVKNGVVDRIVIHAVDRLTRSSDDAEEIDSIIGLDKIIFIADWDRAVLQSVLFASLEIDAISKRTSSYFQKRKEDGYFLGPSRYGFKVKNGKLIPVQEQIEVMNEIKQYRDNGMSFNGIAKLLNNKGIKTLRAEKWTQVQVKACIQRMNDPLLKKIIEDSKWKTSELTV